MPRVLMERSGEMEVFARVVQEGAFSAAARSLELTPSAVSKLIARLEERLGARLLTRTTRALTLTEEGEAYYQSVQRILQALDEADEHVSGDAVRGRLRINASIPFGTMYIAPLIPDFLALHQALSIDLSLTDDVIDLMAQRADVAIRMGNLPDSGLIARKLAETRRVICAAPSYLARKGTPQTPTDLRHHDCVTFNFKRLQSSWPFRADGRDFELSVTGNLQVNNGETMRQMALRGAGIARLGQFHAADDIRAGALVPILETYNPGDLELISAVYVGGGQLPQRVRSFIDYLAEHIEKSPIRRL